MYVINSAVEIKYCLAVAILVNPWGLGDVDKWDLAGEQDKSLPELPWKLIFPVSSAVGVETRSEI